MVDKSLHKILTKEGFQLEDIKPMCNWRGLAHILKSYGYMNDKEKFLLVTGSCVPEAKKFVDRDYHEIFNRCYLVYRKICSTKGSNEIPVSE